MNLLNPTFSSVKLIRRSILHIDPILFLLLILLAGLGLFILYSASIENNSMIANQALRLGMGFILLLVLAQIPPRRYYQWAPWLFTTVVILLLMVMLVGKIGHGGRRWLGYGALRFQPSEIMKIAMPLMMAWFLSQNPLPPKFKPLLISVILFLVPAVMIARQPDLGTAILVTFSALAVLFLAGMSWRLILTFVLICAGSLPILWHFLHTYQKERVFTFLDPEEDPLGSGYHIIQSKIAIGSGGMLGKGWMYGTQSHLSFLPAHTTDFIFAVCGEELGFIGCILILLLFLGIFARCVYISIKAQDVFGRLLAGSLGLTFIFCALINISMVVGIVPVVGIPLPLISYGGSSLLTIMAGFGIIMSIHTHRKIWAR